MIDVNSTNKKSIHLYYWAGIAVALLIAFISGYLLRDVIIGTHIDRNNIATAFLYNKKGEMVVLDTKDKNARVIPPCNSTQGGGCLYTIESSFFEYDEEQIKKYVRFLDRKNQPVPWEHIHNLEIAIKAEINSPTTTVSCTWILGKKVCVNN